MKRRTIPLLSLALLLAGCALPMQPVVTPTSTTSTGQIQTQVSYMLTQLPTETAPISITPAAPTMVIPAPTFTPVVAPTTAPVVTITETPTIQPVNSPTPAPTLAPSATPISTATPAVTSPATDPRLKLGVPTWEDKFANGNNWDLSEGEHTNASLESGGMQLTGLTPLDGWRITWPEIQNFYLEATIKPGTCSGTDRYGLIFRVPDLKTANQGYLFGLTCDGHYSLRKWDGKNMTELITWQTSAAIHSGSNQTNRLGILAVGNHLSLYVNGVFLNDTTNNAYAQGGFGFFVGANKTPDFSILISDVAYWENPNL
ncbi:MAG: hypothetical protein M1281_06575 [Chloroflexi bacterium]|nr:hypothetical protein [Chloroflexota bacterium]